MPNTELRMAGKYMGSVKVGPKGQIVIPKEVRDMFGVQPGDMLVLLADVERGIAIQRYEMFEAITNAILDAVHAPGETPRPPQNP